MAEDTYIDALPWSVFVDSLAGPLRLERPDRQAYGLLMTLHLVGVIWGDLALLRAAARLVGRHAFDLDPIIAAETGPGLSVWCRAFLARHAADAEAPLAKSLLKPAWRPLWEKQS